MTVECLKGHVKGRVQGVGFRQATVLEARRLGLTGWVRNCPDGTVEVLIAGSEEKLTAMLSWLRHGPAGARVDALELEPCVDDAGEGFVRR